MRKVTTHIIGKLIFAAALLMGGAVISQEKDSPKSPWTPEKQREWRTILAKYDYVAIAKAYANFMIEHGRDTYGKVHSPLFVTVMDRETGRVLENRGKAFYPHIVTRPYAPGLRRDHKVRPQDRTYAGGNPIEDLALYELLYRLSELTGEKHYATEADASIAWFLANAQSPATGLYAWGSHMYWDVYKDLPVYTSNGSPSGGYGGHEYNYVWPYWVQNPETLKRFAYGLWNNQIADQKTGHFSRHAAYNKRGVETGYEFPETGACYMDIWAREYGRSGDPEMKRAIQTLLTLYRSMRDPKTGAMAWCTAEGADRREVTNVNHNLRMANTLQDAAAFVEKRDIELAGEMRAFVRQIDDEYLSNEYDKILDVARKGIMTWYTIADRTYMAKSVTRPPDGADASVGFPLTTTDGRPASSLDYLTPWFPGRSYAGAALLLRDRYDRCGEKHKPTYRRAILDTANIYMTIEPEVQFVQYPDNIADVVELLRTACKLTKNTAYLHRAENMMRLGIRLFFDDTSPLPKITNFDNWYESSTKNESSVAILGQMIELSLDLKALAEEQRSVLEIVADTAWRNQDALAAGRVTPAQFKVAFESAAVAGRAGSWSGDGLKQSAHDVILRYGPEHIRSLFLSQADGEFTKQNLHGTAWQIDLSDAINHIPSAAEADKLNGRPARFSGKNFTTGHIDDGGFKDVPRQVALVVRNAGDTATRVRVEATMHDTYHDNGMEHCEQELPPGGKGMFILSAPSLKWIRRLAVSSANKCEMRLEQFAFITTPRSELNPTR